MSAPRPFSANTFERGRGAGPIPGLVAAVAAALFLIGYRTQAAAEDLYTSKTFFIDRTLSDIAFDHEGARVMFALPDDNEVLIRDTSTGADLAVVKTPARVNAGVFSPDGARIGLLMNDGTIGVRDAGGGGETALLKPGEAPNNFAFSPDGRAVAAASIDGAARIIDIATGRETDLIRLDGALIERAAFSPDGRRLALVLAGDAAALWDIVSARETVRLVHPARVNSARFNANGALVVTAADDGAARVFDAADGREILALRGHEGAVLDAAFDAGGARIATGSADRTARVWDAATGAELARLEGHGLEIASAAFTPDGKTLMTLGGASARLWRRQDPVALPDGFAGVWYPGLGAGEETPPDFARILCLAAPVAIRAGGLVVFFESSGDGRFIAARHLRCAAGLDCAAFEGPPAQGLESLVSAKLNGCGESAGICYAENECLALSRCATMEWSEDERANGLAGAWDREVFTGPP